MLKSARIKRGERHEVLGLKRMFAVIEIALAVLEGGIHFLFLEHPSCLETRNADFFSQPGDNHNESLAHYFITRGRNGQDGFKHLTIVIGVFTTIAIMSFIG